MLSNMQVLQDPRAAGRHTLFGDRREVTLYRYFQGLNNESFIDMKNGSWKLETKISCLSRSCSGAIFANGGRLNGFALYMLRGVPVFFYSMAGSLTKLEGTPLRKRQTRLLRILFAYEEGAKGSKGGPATITLCEDGLCVSSARLERTIPNRVNVNDVASVGRDMGSVMVTGHGDGPTNIFQGQIAYVTITLLSPAQVARETQSLSRSLTLPSASAFRRKLLSPSAKLTFLLFAAVSVFTLSWAALRAVAKASSRKWYKRLEAGPSKPLWQAHCGSNSQLLS